MFTPCYAMKTASKQRNVETRSLGGGVPASVVNAKPRLCDSPSVPPGRNHWLFQLNVRVVPSNGVSL